MTDGALLVKLDGVIVEEPENIDPFATSSAAGRRSNSIANAT